MNTEQDSNTAVNDGSVLNDWLGVKQLNAAIAKAYKMRVPIEIFGKVADWDHGGPIIEREGIEIWCGMAMMYRIRCAHVGGRSIGTDDKESLGGTPLLAAMRSFAIGVPAETLLQPDV